MCQLCGTKQPPVPDRLENPEVWPGKTFLRVVGRERRKKIHKGVSYKVAEQTLTAEWKAIEARKQKKEKPLENALRKLFERQIKVLLERLKDRANLKKLATARTKPQITPLVTSSLLQWNKWFDRTGDVAREPLREIIEDGYKTGQDRLGVIGPDFTSNTPFVRQNLNSILFHTKNVQNTFREMVSAEIQRGLTEGDDMEELVQRVAQKTEEQTGWRLRRTVRTAANGGFESGQVEAYRDSGIKEHRWLSQRDARVRSPSRGDTWDHRTADGQTVKVDAAFLIKGRGNRSESLRFPGDPQGSPGNIIHCRCSTRPVA